MVQGLGGLLYDSLGPAFAAAQSQTVATCSPGWTCIADTLQECEGAGKNYLWDIPQVWCWHLTRITPNGQVEFDGIAGTISYIESCPVGIPLRQNLVSGTGQAGDPRFYENYCPVNRTAIQPCERCIGDPIYPASGTQYQVEQDYSSGDGVLSFSRYYDSFYRRFRSEYEVTFVPPTQKVAWTCVGDRFWQYDLQGNQVYYEACFRILNRDPAKAVFSDFKGARDDLSWNGSVGLSTYWVFKSRLTQTTVNGAQTWLLMRPNEGRLLGFDSTGRLLFAQRPDGRRATFTYNNGAVAAMSDEFGRTLQINPGPNGVASIVDPAGQSISYGYADVNKLTSITYQDSSQKTYVWDEPSLSTGTAKPTDLLTGIVDESNNRFASFGYLNGRATSSEHAGGVDRYSIVDSRSFGNGNIAATDPLGTVRTTSYSVVNGFSQPMNITQPSSTGSGTISSPTSYDATGNVSREQDFNGNATCYLNDSTRNLEIVRVEGLASGVSCPSNLVTYNVPANTRQRKISTQFHPTWNIPTAIAEPNRITTWVYNGQPDPTAGGATAQCVPGGATLVDGSPMAVVCKRLVQPTTDTTGTLGFSAQATGTARLWTYTYDSYGRVLTRRSCVTRQTSMTRSIV